MGRKDTLEGATLSLDQLDAASGGFASGANINTMRNDGTLESHGRLAIDTEGGLSASANANGFGLSTSGHGFSLSASLGVIGGSFSWDDKGFKVGARLAPIDISFSYPSKESESARLEVGASVNLFGLANVRAGIAVQGDGATSLTASASTGTPDGRLSQSISGSVGLTPAGERTENESIYFPAYVDENGRFERGSWIKDAKFEAFRDDTMASPAPAPLEFDNNELDLEGRLASLSDELPNELPNEGTFDSGLGSNDVASSFSYVDAQDAEDVSGSSVVTAEDSEVYNGDSDGSSITV